MSRLIADATADAIARRPGRKFYAPPDPQARQRLTQPMRNFCRLMADPTCVSLTDAYRAAYPSAAQATPASISARAFKLARRPAVRSYLRYQRLLVADSLECTPQYLVSVVRGLMVDAAEAKDRRIALDAAKTLGKWYGMEGPDQLAQVAGAAAAGAAAGATAAALTVDDAIARALEASEQPIDVAARPVAQQPGQLTG